MPKRFVSFILIFFVSASALGESLHALPVFDHHATDVCESASTHFDAIDLSSESKCVLCEVLIEFQGLPVLEDPPIEVLSAERSALRSPSLVSTTDVVIADYRGPPASQSPRFPCIGRS